MADFDLGHDGFDEDFDSPHRKRCWMALCYPDNDDMNNWWLNVLPGLDVGYCGRIHDQEGKAHHHVVFVFNEAKTLSACSKNVQYAERWLRPWDSKRKAMRYLCHCDNPEKFQYSPDGIYGSLVDEAVRYCAKGSNESETASVIDIMNLLDSMDCYVRFSDFARVCAEKGYWTTLRRMGTMGTRLIDDHNVNWERSMQRDVDVRVDFDRFKRYLDSGFSKTLAFHDWIRLYDKHNIIPPPLVTTGQVEY